jgi:hypothetical protein
MTCNSDSYNSSRRGVFLAVSYLSKSLAPQDSSYLYEVPHWPLSTNTVIAIFDSTMPRILMKAMRLCDLRDSLTYLTQNSIVTDI